MKVDTALIHEGQVLFVEIDGQHFDGDDYPSTQDTIQAIVNYVEEQAKRGTR